MKKIYLLVVCCLMVFSSNAMRWYSRSGFVDDPNQWYSTRVTLGYSLFSARTPGHYFDDANDTFYIQSLMQIGAITWDVKGSVFVWDTSAAGFSGTLRAGSGTTVVKIGGFLTVANSGLISSGVSSSGTFNILVGGDLNVLDNGRIAPNTIIPGTILFHVYFVDNSTVLAPKGITWTSTGVSSKTALIVNPNSVRVLKSNLPLYGGSDSGMYVFGQGTLMCDTFSVDGGGVGSVTVDPDANVWTKNRGGLDVSIKNMGTVAYSNQAHFIYHGTVPQVTGTTLPASFASGGSVMISNIAPGNGPVTLSQTTDFNAGGRLQLDLGTLVMGATDSQAMMNSGSFVDVDNGKLNAIPHYLFPVDVTYMPLGTSVTLLNNTGNELKASGIGNLTFNKITNAIISLASNVIVGKDVHIIAGVFNATPAAFNISVRGDWVNDETFSSFNRGGSTVIFDGGSKSFIRGTATTKFNNLTMNNAAGVEVQNVDSILGVGTFIAGKMYTGNNDLFLGPAFSSAGSSDLSYIVASVPGPAIKKQYNSASASSFFFPIGDSSTYSPFAVNTQLIAGIGAASNVALNVYPVKEPHNNNVSNYLKRYWSMKVNSIPVFRYNVVGWYKNSDVVGPNGEDSMVLGQWNGSWKKYGVGDTVANMLVMAPDSTSSANSNFTGIGKNRPKLFLSANDTFCAPHGSKTLSVVDSFGDGPLRFTWSPGTGLSATTGNSVTMSFPAPPPVPTMYIYTVTATDANGFTNTAMDTMMVYPGPVITNITATTSVCLYKDITLDVTGTNIATYKWTGPAAITNSSAATATVSSVTLTASGTYSLTVTNGVAVGCRVDTFTSAVTVHGLPPAPYIQTEIINDSIYCGKTLLTGFPSMGPGYDIQDAVWSQGLVMDTTRCCGNTELVTTPGTAEHYMRTANQYGCWSQDSVTDSIQITINPMPDNSLFIQWPSGALGSYCAGGTGLHISVSGSQTGITYTVHHLLGTGTWVTVNALPGTGSPLDFGPYTDAGDYLINATNDLTGCSDTINNGLPITLNINPLPVAGNLYLADNAGTHDKRGYCFGGSGLDMSLDFAGAGTFDYLLYNPDTVGSDFVAIDSIYQPADGPLDYGVRSAQGQYMAIYTDALTGCRDTALTMDSLWVNPLPIVHNVLPGNNYPCYPLSGSPNITIKLDVAEPFVNYTIVQNGDTGILNIRNTGPGTNFVVGVVSPTPDTTVLDSFTVIATDTNGCMVMMTGADTMKFLPLPTPQPYTILPHPTYCPNAVDSNIHFTIASSDPWVTYRLQFNGANVSPLDTGTGLPIDFGTYTAPGTYEVVATDMTTGCNQVVATDYITLRSMPTVYTVSGGGQYCSGGAGVPVFLSASDDASVGYAVYVDHGYVTTVPGDALAPTPFNLGNLTAGGTYTVIATNTQGCTDTMLDSAIIIVNPLPLVHTVTGGGDYCNASLRPFPIELDGSEVGIRYDRFKNGVLLDALYGTGSALNYGSTPITGAYTVIATDTATGCVQKMLDTAAVTAHNLPDTFTVTGGGSFCYTYGGLPIGLAGSQVGITYHLFLAGTELDSLRGTGAAFNFASQSAGGTYTITATNDTTGCFINMNGSKIVNVLPLPRPYLVAGAGIYCAHDTGRHIFLSGSDRGISYELFKKSAPTSPLAMQAGVGRGLDFGLYTAIDSYFVVATNIATTCSLRMNGTVGMTLGTLPTAYNVTGGGTICAGATGPNIGLANSSSNIGYQLMRGGTTVGSAVNGTGTAIVFGSFNTAGTYKVTAVDLNTGCYDTMSGDATVVVSPLPTPFPINGGGQYCEGGAGVRIGIDSTEVGVNYQLRYTLLGTTSNIGAPFVGGGSRVDTIDHTLFTPVGCYTIHAINTTSLCANNMLGTVCVTMNPAPPKYTVIGGGSYCAGDPIGLHVDLSNSDPGINYQLVTGSTLVGGIMPGTHLPIDFGTVTTTGSYFVTAENTTTGCRDTMNGTANIAVIADVIPTVSLNATPSRVIRVGNLDTVTATVAGAGSVAPTYKWTINRNVVPGANSNVLTFAVYYDNDTIDCYVTSNGACGGFTTMKEIIINLIPTGIRQILSSGADIKLLPNPNKGAFSLKGTIGATSDETLSVDVTNMLGQTVYTGSFVAKNGVVDEHIELGKTLANGMYLLNLRSGTDNVVFHFVVEQ